MGNCGTREENAVVAPHAQVQQLHLSQHPAKNAIADRKHTHISSDISNPSTPGKIEDAKNISIYNDSRCSILMDIKGTENGLLRYFLGQLKHPNLVKLIGYCCEDDYRLLVYEFMFRGSLEKHLFRNTTPLPWGTRMSIALGAAKGLACLHNAQRPVIFRDFKTSNILMDSDYTAKLSDFGLLKAGPEGDETHVSTRVMGTYGYAAPEYVMTGHLTARSDVYSFGVVLLELLTGRKSIDKSGPSREQSLVDWALPKLNDKRRLLQIMDPKLQGQYSVRAAHKACILAFYCLSHNPKSRPIMSDVVET
ncbi:unnamed protein product [Urochloa decumbens]|uniref:Protein kinase domain-containing protein n=1 Tax=Urochloa decumbens TaxID=240449 RepID=A0ABC9AZ98_9POAL